VTEAECVSSNGGMARYRLVIEPWLAFLRHRQDSCLFQHQSVFDIVDAVFARYQSQGKLAVQWRWEIAQRDIYPVRGITTQYHESDFDFVARLLAEEGLCYWFEHATGKDGNLGSHTLVIADHNGAFRANAQPSIRFHRADASESEDTIQQWRGSRQLQTNSLAQQSWDYKSVSARPVQQQSRGSGSGASAKAQSTNKHRVLQWSDDPGAYGWETSAQGERLLSNALQALELRNKRFEGQSAVRTLAPATTFTLTGHEQHDKDSEEDRRFAVLAVRHIARNNFDEALKAGVGERLGLPDIATVFDASEDSEQDSGNAAAKPDSVTHYRNDFTTVRAAIPYRPLSVDGHGQRIHPKPSVHGSQSAIVIGTGGRERPRAHRARPPHQGAVPLAARQRLQRPATPRRWTGQRPRSRPPGRLGARGRQCCGRQLGPGHPAARGAGSAGGIPSWRHRPPGGRRSAVQRRRPSRCPAQREVRGRSAIDWQRPRLVRRRRQGGQGTRAQRGLLRYQDPGTECQPER
jgi:type VI secretion system secreted protein VgrG